MRKHPQIPPPPPPEEPAVQGITQHALNQLRDVQIELAERRIEALRLYCPMPKQEEFHQCMASERLLIGGNRSGKSAASFVEDARAATGQDPYGKYPKEGGNLVIIGRNWPHIGLVVVPMLFRAGAFKMIKDELVPRHRRDAFFANETGALTFVDRVTIPAPLVEVNFHKKNAGAVHFFTPCRPPAPDAQPSIAVRIHVHEHIHAYNDRDDDKHVDTSSFRSAAVQVCRPAGSDK